MDQLGQKLLEKKGVSWNKKYRKQYGALRKVICMYVNLGFAVKITLHLYSYSIVSRMVIEITGTWTSKIEHV